MSLLKITLSSGSQKEEKAVAQTIVGNEVARRSEISLPACEKNIQSFFRHDMRRWLSRGGGFQKHVFSFFVFVSIVLFFGLSSQDSLRAEYAKFYPGSCSGGWVNAQNAEGKTDLLPGASSSDFNDANSAVLAGASSQIFCGNFIGKTPEEAEMKTLLLKFSWTNGSIANITATDASDITDDNASSTVAIVSGEDVASSTQKILDAPADATIELTLGESGTSSPSYSPEKEDAIRGEEVPANSSAEEGAKAPDAPISLFEKLFRTVFAETVSELSDTAVTSTEQIIETTGENGTSTEETLLVSTPPIEEDKAPASPDLLEVLYTLDGNTWFSLGKVNRTDWQSEFRIPVSEWEDISKLQISIQSIPTIEEVPAIYLDGMWLEAEYHFFLSEPINGKFLSDEERSKLPKKNDPDFFGDQKKDFRSDEDVFFDLPDVAGAEAGLPDVSLVATSTFATTTTEQLNTGTTTPTIATTTEQLNAGTTTTTTATTTEQLNAGTTTTITEEQESPIAATGTSAFGNIFRSFRLLPQARAQANSGAEILSAEVLDWRGDRANIRPFLDTGGGKTRIKIPRQGNAFHPGKYKLRAEILWNGEIIKTEQDFTWGVLAVNVNKSIYLPGESAYLQMSALDDVGGTLCDEELRLEIENPDAEKTILETKDGSIQKSSTCGRNNVTDTPDYFAHYFAGTAGIYRMTLRNMGNGYSISDTFTVENDMPFEVERVGATRINPFAAEYKMTFHVKANGDFKGVISENVPKDFEVVPDQFLFPATLTETSERKTISWEAEIKSGDVIALSYQYQAPKISPQVFLLGPLEFYESKNWLLRIIGEDAPPIFEETRRWQIASDALSLTQRAYIFLNDDGATVDSYTKAHSAATSSSISNVKIGEKLIARIQIDNTGDASSTDPYRLQWRVSGGTFADLSTTTAVSYSLSQKGALWGRPDGVPLPTMQVLATTTCSTAKYQAGRFVAGTATSTSFSIGPSKCTEIAYAINTANAALNTTYELRVVRDAAATVLNSYYVYPTFTTETARTLTYSKEARGAYAINNLDLLSTQYVRTNMAIGSDGFPAVSYADNLNNVIKFAKCNDASCSSSATSTMIGLIGDQYPDNSIAIGSDGFPVISYHDADTTSGYLKFIKCNDISCSSKSYAQLDGAFGTDSGPYNSIAIGSDGFPVISYQNETYDLSFIKCKNIDCSSFTSSDLDTTGTVGLYTSIAIGSDGFPVISYVDYTNADIKFAKCNDISCSAPSISAIDSTGNLGRGDSIAIGSDGFPVIAYHDYTNNYLKFAKCNDISCSSPAISTIDNSGISPTGMYNSIAIGSDGFPVISYVKENYNLGFIKCNNISCSSFSLSTFGENTGSFSSVAIGTDGFPVVATMEAKILKCASVDCSDGTTAASNLPSTAVSYDNFLDDLGYNNVATSDNFHDSLFSAASSSLAYNFKKKNTNTTDGIIVTWEGQISVSTSTSLQIYNNTSGLWETLESSTTPQANNDFTLTGTVSGAGYYDGSNIAAIRAVTGTTTSSTTLKTDRIAVTFAPGTLDQTSYQWFANANGVQPGIALQSEGASHTLTSTSSPIRLRMNLTAGLAAIVASSTDFTLQYAWSVNGPWTNVGWWNSSWLNRKKISLNNSSATGDITDLVIPVCLRATANAICGAIDYSKTQNGGEDIRFVDANGTTTLSYEIEKWDESATSTVWVKIPKVNAATSTDYVWMYYNNTGASDAQSAATLWSGIGAQAVWHLANSASTTNAFTNSTSTSYGAGTGNGGASLASTTGKFGRGYTFDGTDDYISGSGVTSDAAPTFIQEAETVWNNATTPKTTASFNVQAGDILAAYAITNQNAGSATLGISGGSLTWTLQQRVAVSSYDEVAIWTTTVDSDKSMTVSFTCNGTYYFGGNVFTFRGSDGVGASSKTNIASGAPTLNITTTQAKSAVVVTNGDWVPVDGASRTWRTGAGALTEQTYSYVASNYTVYGGYHADAGAVGTYAVGLSAPTGQKYSIVAAEVKGILGGVGGLNISSVKSVSFWAKPNSTTQSIIDMDGTKNIDISSGVVRANNFTTPTIYVDGEQTTTFPDTNWHYVTVTTGTAVDATALKIGKISSGYYGGVLEDVQMYSRVLSADEILAEYKAGAGTYLSYSDEESFATVPFSFYNGNGSATDGTNITSTLLSASDVKETYESANFTATTTQYAIPVGNSGEWDFALDPTNATTTTYYFRMVKANGSVPLDTYTSYPTLIVDNSSLTFAVSTDVFGTLTPGSYKIATSTLNVTTNKTTGYYVTMYGNNQGSGAASTTMYYASTPYSPAIADQTEWVPGAATSTSGNAVVRASLDNSGDVLAFRVMTASGSVPFFSTAWWGASDADGTAKWAGIASSTVPRTIGNSSQSAPAGALSTVQYYLDVSNTQQAGNYTGDITFTATMNL
jgi:hypothetical protein